MTWVRLDDGIFYNPKIADLSDAAQLAHIKAIVYCSQGRTDGLVPLRISKQLASPKVLKELVPLLWHLSDDLCERCRSIPDAVAATGGQSGGFYVHDYLEYNPTRAEVEEEDRKRHEARREAGRLGGIASGVARRKQTRSKTEANEEANHQAKGKQNEAPSRPVPSPLARRSGRFATWSSSAGWY
jgi:hypothetical protein